MASTNPPKPAIEVRVSNNDIAAAGSDSSARLIIYDKCVAAGMPIAMDPFTSSVYVTDGVLETRELFERDALLIRWEPSPPPAPEQPVSMWSRIKQVAKAVWEA